MDTLEALRLLSSLSLPSRRATAPIPGAAAPGRLAFPWEALWQPAIANGLAPLVAYNLEYRLGGGAPQDIHDALLGYYQGTLNDNVYKLVTLKRLLDEVEAPVVLLHAAAYADALYPHIAFRPLPEIRLLAARSSFFAIAEAARPQGFVPEAGTAGTLALTDQRFRIVLHEGLGGGARLGTDLHERGIPARALGLQVFRPAIEDALLTHLALLVEAAFEAPLIDYVDLRELVLGAPSQGGTWGKPPEARQLLTRAREVGLSHALFCAMALLAHFFPEVAEQARSLSPELPAGEKSSLEEAVIAANRALGPTPPARPREELQRLLEV